MNTAFRLLSKRKTSGGVTTYGISFNGVNQYLKYDFSVESRLTSGGYCKFKITKTTGGNQTIVSGYYLKSDPIREWSWLSIQNGTLIIRPTVGSSGTPVNMQIGPTGIFSAAGTYDVLLEWPSLRSYNLTINGVLYTGSVASGSSFRVNFSAAKANGDTTAPSEYNLFTIHELEYKDSGNIIHRYENTTGTGTVWEDTLADAVVVLYDYNLINGPTWVPNP